MKGTGLKFVLVLVLAAALGRMSVYAQTIEIGTEAVEFIKVGDDWDFFRGTTAPSDPPDAWRTEIDFNYPGWESGPSGFGYGDSDDATVLSDMEDNYHTVYVRKVFQGGSVSLNATVQLVIDYDDGFIAYLNGAPVEARNSDRGTDGRLGANHEAGTPLTLELGAAGDLLNEGANLLAIEGLNVDLGSSDFSLIPALRAVSDLEVVLTEDTTWSGTYLIKSPVVVPEGVVLTIEPGSVIMMQSGAGMTVYGQLLAEGTEGEPITFTRDAAGSTWERIMFVNADDSRLVHCIIEYAGVDGNHKDYYGGDCDPGTPLPSRDYKEALVALASHLDILGCTFQNLPNNGDALAIISDDPDNPGDSTANIVGCQFLSIGQGVHTRFSYVLVEDCYFTDHDGDNDDVDLYGESDPVPLIRNNLFMNSHDDMINPTRCSAVFIGNVIIGASDHGVVLRGECYPTMINNVIYDCTNGCIAVQNQCDALLVNNTLVKSKVGIKFFDHTGRWGPPYCLLPGSGKATIVNCIIRDCPTSFDLDNSPSTEDPGSHATVSYSNIQGGRGSASVSSNSTLTWGEGNIEDDPQFADLAGGDFHLRSQAGRWDAGTGAWVADAVHSACIDAGDPFNTDWTEELWPHGGIINMGAYGGTPEASMSSLPVGHAADLNHDNVVSIEDMTQLAAQWRAQRRLLDSDLDRDGSVGVGDLAILAEAWLWRQP